MGLSLTDLQQRKTRVGKLSGAEVCMKPQYKHIPKHNEQEKSSNNTWACTHLTPHAPRRREMGESEGRLQ